MPVSQKVLELQSEFVKRLSLHEPFNVFNVSPIDTLLYQLIDCDDEILELTLGKLGYNLRNFAQHIDFQHPGISSIFDGIIADNQEFALNCIELLTLGKIAKENNLQRIIPSLGKIITNESIPKDVLKKLDISNRTHVRLLKDEKERQEIRTTKKMQIIDLHFLYKKGKEIWQVQPDSFAKYLRFNSAYQDDLDLAEKKINHYEKLRCNVLAEEIRQSIACFKKNLEESYYGFNRITMTTASIILAKSLGYNYDENENQIFVDRKFFGKYDFDPEQLFEFSPLISSRTSTNFFSERKREPFLFEPRVYPLHEFQDIATNQIKSSIAILENFPDAGNKPIFDHFGIIVPGVNFPKKNQSLYCISDQKGFVQNFKIREDALKILDKILVKEGYLDAILIGEKDGKCYFISYFT